MLEFSSGDSPATTIVASFTERQQHARCCAKHGTGTDPISPQIQATEAPCSDTLPLATSLLVGPGWCDPPDPHSLSRPSSGCLGPQPHLPQWPKPPSGACLGLFPGTPSQGWFTGQWGAGMQRAEDLQVGVWTPCTKLLTVWVGAKSKGRCGLCSFILGWGPINVRGGPDEVCIIIIIIILLLLLSCLFYRD